MGRVTGALLAGLLLGAVGGGVVSRLLFADESREANALELRSRSSGSNGDARSTAGSPLDAGVSASVAAAPHEAARSVEVASSSSAPSDVVERLVASARSAAPPSPPRGSKRIAGRVVDEHGSPVEGVRVRVDHRAQDDAVECWPERSTTGSGAPPSDALDDEVRTAVVNWYRNNGDRRETRTDADGRYTFADLVDGEWSVAAWRAGYEIGVAPGVQSFSIRPDATIDFVAQSVAQVEVRVVAPDGSLATQAALHVTRLHERPQGSPQLWSAAERTVPLLAGKWSVRATVGEPNVGPPNAQLLVSDWQTVAVEIGVAPAPVTLQLHGTPGIHGRVKHSAGELDDVRVRLMPAGTATDSIAQALEQVDAMDGRWTCSRDEFRFDELLPGRYWIGASRGRGQVLVHAEVDVRDSIVEQDLELPPLDRARCLVVRALEPDGRPVDDASFSVDRYHGKDRRWCTGVSATKDEQGNYLLSFAEFGEEIDLTKPWDDDVRVELRVRDPLEAASKTVELHSGEHSLEVQLVRSASLAVTVQGYAGSAYVERLRFELERDLSGRRVNSLQGDFGPTGVATWNRLEPGRYVLHQVLDPTVSNRFSYFSGHEIAATALDLVSGDNEATVSIPQLYTATVEVQAGAEGSLELSRDGESNEEWNSARAERPDAHGRATFVDLPAGDYVLSFDADGRDVETMPLRVPVSGVVRFRPTEWTAFTVRIGRTDGALAKAGLQDDDKIVAIDGKEFTTRAELQAAMAAALGKKSVVFGVARGGKRIELTLDPQPLQNPAELGGSLRPTTR